MKTFELMLNVPMSRPVLHLPTQISNMPPQQLHAIAAGAFNPNPLQPCKKKLTAVPAQQKDARDVSTVLSGAELMNIHSGPTILDFGTIFVKSAMSQTFWIRNDNPKTIIVHFRS